MLVKGDAPVTEISIGLLQDLRAPLFRHLDPIALTGKMLRYLHLSDYDIVIKAVGDAILSPDRSALYKQLPHLVFFLLLLTSCLHYMVVYTESIAKNVERKEYFGTCHCAAPLV